MPGTCLASHRSSSPHPAPPQQRLKHRRQRMGVLSCLGNRNFTHTHNWERKTCKSEIQNGQSDFKVFKTLPWKRSFVWRLHLEVNKAVTFLPLRLSARPADSGCTKPLLCRAAETPNEISWCVCRHYLAMTKGALSSCSSQWKIQGTFSPCSSRIPLTLSPANSKNNSASPSPPLPDGVMGGVKDWPEAPKAGGGRRGRGGGPLQHYKGNCKRHKYINLRRSKPQFLCELL